MRLRSVCSFLALCAVLWTSGCYFDHCGCRRHVRPRDCGCPCESSCYAPTDHYGPPPLAPVIPPPTPLMPSDGK